MWSPPSAQPTLSTSVPVSPWSQEKEQCTAVWHNTTLGLHTEPQCLLCAENPFITGLHFPPKKHFQTRIFFFFAVQRIEPGYSYRLSKCPISWTTLPALLFSFWDRLLLILPRFASNSQFSYLHLLKLRLPVCTTTPGWLLGNCGTEWRHLSLYDYLPHCMSLKIFNSLVF
jgi:hypothetical protein